MSKLELKKLLAQGEIQIVANELNYESFKLTEYLTTRAGEDTYGYLQDLGDEITNELLQIINSNE